MTALVMRKAMIDSRGRGTPALCEGSPGVIFVSVGSGILENMSPKVVMMIRRVLFRRRSRLRMTAQETNKRFAVRPPDDSTACLQRAKFAPYDFIIIEY